MNPLMWAYRQVCSWWAYRPGGSAAREAERRRDARATVVRADVGVTAEDALETLRESRAWFFHYAPNGVQPEAIAAVRTFRLGAGRAPCHDVILFFSEQFTYGYRATGTDPFTPKWIKHACHGGAVEVCGEMLALRHPEHRGAPQVPQRPTTYELALFARFHGPKVMRVPDKPPVADIALAAVRA